jgi:hypothetical protein
LAQPANVRHGKVSLIRASFYIAKLYKVSGIVEVQLLRKAIALQHDAGGPAADDGCTENVEGLKGEYSTGD